MIMKTFNNLILITWVSLGYLVFPIPMDAQINTRVLSGANLSKKINLSEQTPVLTASRDDIAKSLPTKKLRKQITRKATSDFAEKIPEDYRPKSGKLNANLNAQKPYTPRAYIEYANGKYEPMNRRIGLPGNGWIYGGDLFVKFKARSGKRYLVRLRLSTTDNTSRSLQSYEEPIMYCYMGDVQTTFPLEKSFGVLTNKEYEFDLIIQASTNNWIQIPFLSGILSTDSRYPSSLSVPWSFTSVNISEL